MPRDGFTARVIEQARIRAGGKCETCGGPIPPGRGECHHIKPRWKGGDNTLENARFCCPPCHLAADAEHDFGNQRKADRKGKATRSLETAAGMPEIFRRMGVKP